jgi:hypothetical protein
MHIVHRSGGNLIRSELSAETAEMVDHYRTLYDVPVKVKKSKRNIASMLTIKLGVLNTRAEAKRRVKLERDRRVARAFGYLSFFICSPVCA